MPRHAVDEVEDGGGLPAWTEKEDALFSLVPPAVRCWRSGSLHPPAGSVRDGPAARPRLVSILPQTVAWRLKADACPGVLHKLQIVCSSINLFSYTITLKIFLTM